MGNLLYICICILFRKLKYFTNINTTRPVDFLAVQAGSQEAVASRHTLTHRWRERETLSMRWSRLLPGRRRDIAIAAPRKPTIFRRTFYVMSAT